MGFYRNTIFPRIMNACMSSGPEAAYRAAALAGVKGDILEIGFGTGLNLPHYPKQISRITAIDANKGMNPLAKRHIGQSPIEVDLRFENAEKLSFPDNSFDSVVSTWTLCSIEDVESSLREIHRVLKPGGEFFFIEHGLSNEAKVQKWQHRLTPLNRRMAAGCHLDRDIKALVGGVEWEIEQLTEFYAEKSPKSFGYLYQGIALKPF